MAAEGSYKAYFRGNGANVIKNVPETALKLTCNDRVKSIIAKDGRTVTLGMFAAQQSLDARPHLTQLSASLCQAVSAHVTGAWLTYLQVSAWLLVASLAQLHRAPSILWRSSRQGWQSALLAPIEGSCMPSPRLCTRKATRLFSGEEQTSVYPVASEFTCQRQCSNT